MKKVLIIVDPQKDFLDDGTLPVMGSFTKMCNLANKLKATPVSEYDHIYVTLDWHPYNHCSFNECGGEWNRHCVAFTDGALIAHPLLEALDKWVKNDKLTFLTKGTAINREEYSILQNEISKRTLLPRLYESETIEICGIVDVVCVKNTIQDIIHEGLKDRLVVNVPYCASFDDGSNFKEWLTDTNVKTI